MKIVSKHKESQIIEKLWRRENPWNPWLRKRDPENAPTHDTSRNFRFDVSLFDYLKSPLPINQDLRDKIAIVPVNADTTLKIVPENSHVLAFCLEGGLVNMDLGNPIILTYNSMMYMPPSYTQEHILSSNVLDSTVLLMDMAQEEDDHALKEQRAISPDIYNLDWVSRPGKEALITDLAQEFGFAAAFEKSPWANGKLKFLFFEKGQDIKFHQHPKQDLLKIVLSGSISYQNHNEILGPGTCGVVRKSTSYHGKADGASRMLLMDLTG